MLVDILMIKAVVYPDVLTAAAKRLCVKRIWTDDKKAAVQAGLGSFFYLQERHASVHAGAPCTEEQTVEKHQGLHSQHPA